MTMKLGPGGIKSKKALTSLPYFLFVIQLE